MFKRIKDWYTKPQRELEAHISDLSTIVDNVTKERDEAQAKLAELQAIVDADKQKREGSTPWVEITSGGFDATKGIKVEMDWNDAFIDYLEELSIKGPTAQAAVQRWLALVNLHLIEQLEQEAIDTDPRGTVRDVVDGY